MGASLHARARGESRSAVAGSETAQTHLFSGAVTTSGPSKNVAIFVVVGIALFMLLAYSSGATVAASPGQTVGSIGETTYYAVVIDAGSSGSRVHAFKFNRNKGGSELDIDYFKQLKPGLSSYGEDAESAAKSLKPLLDYAVSNIPASRHRWSADAPWRAIAEHPERCISVPPYQLSLQALGCRPCNNHGWRRRRHVRMDHHQLPTQQDWQAGIPHCYHSGFRRRIYSGRICHCAN